MATLLDPLHPLQSLIVENLAESPFLTFEELSDQIIAKNMELPSIPNLYRTVRLLVQAQVLTRQGKRLALNQIWISNLLSLANICKANYATENLPRNQIPSKEHSETVYSAESLYAIDSTWNNILGVLTEVSKSEDWYFFNAHPWWSLGMREAEYRLFKGITAKKIALNAVYGGTSFLDEYGSTLIKVSGLKVARTNSTRSPFGHDSIWLCGDYLVFCAFPQAINQQFDFFFNNVQTIADFDPQSFQNIFQMKCKIQIVVRKSTLESKRLRKKFSQLFD